MKSKINILIILLVLGLLALGFYYWQMDQKSKEPVLILPKHREAQQAPSSLGAQIYEKNQNPVSGQVPSTNPIKDAYKNPFE